MRGQTTTRTHQSEIASIFDSEAARYDAAYDAANGHVLRARYDAVLEVLGSGPGEILDGGMGPGRLCEELDGRGWHISGLDLSAAMVEVARRRVPHARERLLRGSIEALPFADATFDAAVAMGVLEYLDDLATSLHDFARVLRPGGTLVVTIPNARSIGGVWGRHVWRPALRAIKQTVPGFSRPAPYRMPPAITERGLADELRAAGLEVDGVRHVGYVLLPTRIGGRVGRTGGRAAQRIAAKRLRATRPLANQIVVCAHKPASPVWP